MKNNHIIVIIITLLSCLCGCESNHENIVPSSTSNHQNTIQAPNDRTAAPDEMTLANKRGPFNFEVKLKNRTIRGTIKSWTEFPGWACDRCFSLFGIECRLENGQVVESYGSSTHAPNTVSLNIILKGDIRKEGVKEGVFLPRTATDNLFQFRNAKATYRRVVKVDGQEKVINQKVTMTLLVP